MKTLVITIMLLSAFVASQAQLITFNALKNGVTDVTEIKKELILNGFTKVTKASDSYEDVYAWGYNDVFERAKIWVHISPLSNDSKGFNVIDVQSDDHEIHEYLKEEIIQNCTFEGIENDVLIYNFNSNIVFHIASEDGRDMITAGPPIDILLQEIDPEILEHLLQEEMGTQRTEQERIERERQEQAERLNYLGRDAFGNQGVGETEGSEGITQGSGNQGDPNGSPDADRYGTGGGLGDGISYGGLGSRRSRGSLPKPNMSGCDVTQKIEVQVEV